MFDGMFNDIFKVMFNVMFNVKILSILICSGLAVKIETVNSNGEPLFLEVINDICNQTELCSYDGDRYYETFDRNFPRGFDEEIYGKQFMHQFAASYICDQNNLTDITCLGRYGNRSIREYITILHKATVDWGCIVETPIYRIQDTRLLESDIWKMKPEWGIDRNNKTILHEKKVAMTISRWSFSYYHFITEALWRIVVLLGEIKTNKDLKILAYKNNFIRSYLIDILQIEESQIIWGPNAKTWKDTFNGPIIEAEELIYPSASLMVAPSRSRLRYLRQEVLKIVESISLNEHPKEINEKNKIIIYLSRNGEWARNIEDESFLLRLIQEYFPTHRLIVLGRENTSNDTIEYKLSSDINEMIKLINKAEIIIGPHGAGFSNILWAIPGTKVIEILPSTSSTLIYWHIAEALDLEYWTIVLPESHWRTRSLPVIEAPIRHILFKVSAGKTHSCQCSKGTYYDMGLENCRLCPPDTYNNIPGSFECTVCPSNFSTQFEEWPMPFVKSGIFRKRYGSDSLSDCKNISQMQDNRLKRDIQDNDKDLDEYYKYYQYNYNDDDDDDDDDDNDDDGDNNKGNENPAIEEKLVHIIELTTTEIPVNITDNPNIIQNVDNPDFSLVLGIGICSAILCICTILIAFSFVYKKYNKMNKDSLENLPWAQSYLNTELERRDAYSILDMPTRRNKIQLKKSQKKTLAKMILDNSYDSVDELNDPTDYVATDYVVCTEALNKITKNNEIGDKVQRRLSTISNPLDYDVYREIMNLSLSPVESETDSEVDLHIYQEYMDI